ncbi:LOW QUALITY PROTEIN: ras and Rab interactor 3 [Sorex fumeus]|uniref:LOW QUALITY PROTEIN: ras and Rab interactor 3 n=1 Tax=Sorex fumeus TaxID=62283 RepID=UPI0024AD8A8D|nr:LOW QUALITY PROTEIN: ras and Rab interactor 3 [Sorex fumeus]
MIRRAGAPARGDPAGPVPDVGKGEEEEEEEEEGMEPPLPLPPWNCLPRRGFSILEKLMKTSPVWQQPDVGQAEAARILSREGPGAFLVRRDGGLKPLLLCVHFPGLQEGAADVLEYAIKEEKSILYLEGSVLVFEDIFRLVAFYCVSRDLLPFTLRLPAAILEAGSCSELETVASLGLGFWDSSLNLRGGSRSPEQPPRDPDPGAPPAAGLRPTTHSPNCACEIELSAGNGRLWFVNPIFLEDCGSPPGPGRCPRRPSSPAPQATSPASKWAPRRPPPPPPTPPLPQSPGPARPPPPPTPAPACPPSTPPAAAALPPVPPDPDPRLAPCDPQSQPPMTACDWPPQPPAGLGPLREEETQPGPNPSLPLLPASNPPTPTKKNPPAAPPRRRFSETARKEDRGMATEGTPPGPPLPGPALPGTAASAGHGPPRTPEQEGQEQEGQEDAAPASQLDRLPELPPKPRQPPIPPPRKKRLSRQLASALPSPRESAELPAKEQGSPKEKPRPGRAREGHWPASPAGTRSRVPQAPASTRPQSAPEFKGSLASLAESVGAPAGSGGGVATDQDSYSTSSTEEELEPLGSSAAVRKKSSLILGKARHRLSLASVSSVFRSLLSTNRKLYKKVVELAQDKASYFGSLVQDYKVYSLEMMARQTSSTELLQEIRTMMTQLKSYLLQSTELTVLADPTLHADEELEAIVESALYKCVLKPLQEAINTCLHEIHTKDCSLQQLKENQQVVLGTTTTDLGVTTSVPEVAVMEKILQKFASMHKAYSPEKKISTLLKTCKLIYDSMALGNPGKPYGADDFLPVLMYVLARSNLTEMLLDVEYMMELMDPALQLGEGSYYLTTTYGALEHIKNYDKITVTRQLSVEVQDSIHRWERRRTLNKARASRSSVQDFICVSYLEPEQQSRTLASRSDTPAEALCAQCAEKFEVPQPQDHRLFVLVDGRCFQLADEALPHRIKGYLLRSEPKRDFHFVYRPLDGGGPPCLVVREPNFL